MKEIISTLYGTTTLCLCCIDLEEQAVLRSKLDCNNGRIKKRDFIFERFGFPFFENNFQSTIKAFFCWLQLPISYYPVNKYKQKSCVDTCAAWRFVLMMLRRHYPCNSSALIFEWKIEPLFSINGTNHTITEDYLFFVLCIVQTTTIRNYFRRY